MALRNGGRQCGWSVLALVTWLAIGFAPLSADEYPVLAVWTQGRRVTAEPPAPAVVDLSALRIIIGEEEEFGGGFWIGVYPRILNAEETQQLGEREPRGVVVNRVVPASPAAEAKLLEGDIIVGAAGQEINYLDELAEIVKRSEGQPIRVDVLREGEMIQVEVTPALRFDRPGLLFFGEKVQAEREEITEQREQAAPGEQAATATEELDALLQKIRARQLQGRNDPAPQEKPRAAQPGRLGLTPRPQLPMPGAPVPVMDQPAVPHAGFVPGPPHANLPDDMQVTIQKRGQRPVRVTVKQGEKLWQTTERELGMLPPEALRYVLHLLGRPRMPGPVGVADPNAAKPGPGSAVSPVPNTAVPEQPLRLKFRLDREGNLPSVQPNGELKPIKGSPEGIRIQIRAAGEGGEEMPEHEGKSVEWTELRRRWLAKREEELQANDERRARAFLKLVEELQGIMEEQEKMTKASKEKKEQK